MHVPDVYRGREEEIDGERWCRTLRYESPHQPQIHCLLLASNAIRHWRHRFLKGCNAHFTANIHRGKWFLSSRQWESGTTITTMRTHYSHGIHFPRGPSTRTITPLTVLIYATDAWHSAAAQSFFFFFAHRLYQRRVSKITYNTIFIRMEVLTNHRLLIKGWYSFTALHVMNRQSLCRAGKGLKGGEESGGRRKMGTFKTVSICRWSSVSVLFLYQGNFFHLHCALRTFYPNRLISSLLSSREYTTDRSLVAAFMVSKHHQSINYLTHFGHLLESRTPGESLYALHREALGLTVWH